MSLTSADLPSADISNEDDRIKNMAWKTLDASGNEREGRGYNFPVELPNVVTIPNLTLLQYKCSRGVDGGKGRAQCNIE